MRLIRLEFEGIGSFAERTEVDFATLADCGLFLIEGPTGSGKSTILDAIVFALYGSVAGSASDDGRLDSHLRNGSPFVELEFEVAGEVYRVHRSPAHERRKLRGDGTTSQPVKASLMRVTDNGFETLGTRASEVGEHICRIVGLTKKQFVSTVVLAQGEFAAFLDADTGKRAQILERVFGTEFYKDVEDQLQVMRQQARRHRADAEAALEAAVHESAGILGVELDPQDPLAGIDLAVAALREQLAAVQAEAARAEEHVAQASAAQAAAEAMVDSQRRKRAALARKGELDAAAERIEQWRASLSAHERAVPVLPSIEACEQARRRLDAARESQRRALAGWSAHGSREPATAEVRSGIDRTLAGLVHPLEVESGLSRLREALQEAGQQRERAEAARARAEQEAEGIAVRLRSVTEEFAGIPDASRRVAEVQQQLTALRMRAELTEQLRAGHASLQVAQETALEAENRLREAEQRLRDAEDGHRRDQAAALAAELVDGQPCMVCGSQDHPHPAVPEQAPQAGQLRELSEVVAGLRERARAARADADRLVGSVEGLQSRLPTDSADVGEEIARRESEHDELSAAAHRREELRAMLDDLTGQQQRLTADITGVAVAAETSRAQEQAARVALDSAQQLVTQARDEFPTVVARVAALEARRDLIQAIIDADTEVTVREDALREAGATLAATLGRTGFASEEQVREGLLDEAEFASRTDAVQVWQRDTEQVSVQLRDLAEVDLDTEVDLAAAGQATIAARERLRVAQEQAGWVSDRLGRAQPQRESVAARIKELTQVRESTQAVIRMADFATAARNEVVHKIRLSSFVLMRRFEDVVNAANDRLDSISEGRYQLVVEADGLDNRGQTGLDLRIYDGRSDSRRSTGSLSGGERFYVSLALALGLADVVRGESGGVELGTLFIDEGFGSLDDEVLDEVMDMLEQVRVGEDRVIGLISHVDLLKQRIDPRISVRRDPHRPGVSTLQVHA